MITISNFVLRLRKYEEKWGYPPLRAVLNRKDYIELKQQFMKGGRSVESKSLETFVPQALRYSFLVDGVDVVTRNIPRGKVRML
jgi:hypothetical protein